MGAELPANKGTGSKWEYKKSDSIRIMKGRPNDPKAWDSQKVDYVKVVSKGNVLDQSGNIISSKIVQNPGSTAEAHIPLKIYRTWRKWNKP
ncbi:MAG: hypothetical protein EOP45_16785 [Sphingobacteriaceae bacterium]|nr:MAG: hypothetical protein EOP45_16785 [Sphingobacteriaceae bacterium]